MERFIKEITPLAEKAAADKNIFPYLQPVHEATKKALLRELQRRRTSKTGLLVARRFLGKTGYDANGIAKDTYVPIMLAALDIHRANQAHVIEAIKTTAQALKEKTTEVPGSGLKQHVLRNPATHIETAAIIGLNFLNRIDKEGIKAVIGTARVSEEDRRRIVEYLDG